MVDRLVRAARNPFVVNKVGRVNWTVGTEAVDVIKVTASLKSPRGKAVAQRVSVRGWLSDASTGSGLSVAPPSGGVAIAAKGVLHPGSPLGLYSLITAGTLAIDAVPEKFKTTATAVYTAGGLVKTKAATTALVFSAAHVVAAAKYGIVLVQIDSAGAVTTKVPAATPTTPMTYASAAAALAALPVADDGKVALGYITLNNSASDGSSTGAWVAITDDLTNTSDITAAAFVDATPVNTVPLSFNLTTDASGVVDLNLTHSGAKTLYVCLQMPDGSIWVSPAVTFAA